MTIYDKLKNSLISAFREIAGLSEYEAKRELDALEFELKKLSEKVERGECSLEDAIRGTIRKVEIYSPPAFRQKMSDRAIESLYEKIDLFKELKREIIKMEDEDYIAKAIRGERLVDEITGEEISRHTPIVELPTGGVTSQENWDQYVELSKKYPEHSVHDIYEMIRKEKGYKRPQNLNKRLQRNYRHIRLYGNFKKRFFLDLAFSKQLIVTEEEFIEFVETYKPPKGYVWARMRSGAPPGFVKVYLKESTPPKYSDTNLERKFEEILNELGFKEEIDYQKQYLFFTYRIDFAFPHLKIAFEPGATYYHTPKWVEGKALEPFGFSPEEVYYPTKPDDIRKDRLLKRKGWVVGWLNENFVKNLSEVKEWVNRIVDKNF